MNKPAFALIGCGKIAPRHAAEITKLGYLVAVCDIITERAQEFATLYNATAYTNLDDMLRAEKPDILVVCTPNGLHTEHSIAGIKAGAHVLCEKPLCIKSTDGIKMKQAAETTNRKLFVVKSTRYNPALQMLHDKIKAGLLGKLYSFQLNCFWNRPASYYGVSWRGTMNLDGGTLLTQFSHYIDALIWLLGDVQQVWGIRKNLAHQNSIEFEDSGTAVLKMQSGLAGGFNWSVNTFEKNMEISLTVIAEKGTIRLGGEFMNEVTYQNPSLIELSTDANGKANDYGYYKGSMSNHDKVYLNLIKALEDDNHPFTDVNDGLRTVMAIEKIYQSIPLT